jgi:hypothetical protein
MISKIPATFFSLLLLPGAVTLAGEEAKPDVAPVISRPGDLIFEDDFDEADIRSEWVPLHGTRWAIVDGTLRGQPSTKEYQQEQTAKGNKRHSGGTPSSRLMVRTDDCIMLFRFKLSQGLKGAHFGFNDGTFKSGTGHVCRLTATTHQGLTLQKDKNAKLKGDKDESLITSDFNLKPDTWYWMMLEVVGDQMVAQVSGGPVLRARHTRIDRSKGQINLPTRGGGVIFYDHVRVWKALTPREAP